jgi:hypothetical protein
MKTVVSNVLLAAGGWTLFLGVMLLAAPAAGPGTDPGSDRRWGVFFAGAGLAITLREFAYQLGERLRGGTPTG